MWGPRERERYVGSTGKRGVCVMGSAGKRKTNIKKRVTGEEEEKSGKSGVMRK